MTGVQTCALPISLKGSDTQAIKAATEEVNKAFAALGEKVYGQQAGGPGPDMGGAGFAGGQPGPDGGPDVVDADYEVVDDDNK